MEMEDDKTATARTLVHADALSRHFNNEDSLVCVQACIVFLYRVYMANFEPKGLSFEEYCTDIGKILAINHTWRQRIEHAESSRN